MMRIIFQECKKALTSPILIALLIVFSAFNIFVIVSSSDHKEELKIINEIIETYGLEITDDSLEEFKRDIQIDIAELNRMTASEFTSVNEFLDGLHFGDQEKYNDKQWEFIHQLQLKEMYLNMAYSIDGTMKKLIYRNRVKRK